jgi:hypothetical protein
MTRTCAGLTACLVVAAFAGAAQPASASALRDARVARDTTEIENVMGRYVATNSGPNLAARTLALFDLSDPTVAIQIADAATLTGRVAVTQYWQTLQSTMERNGGALGAHLLTSPVVVVARSGRTATGQWQDSGTTLFGPGMGAAPRADGHTYTAIREVSRYTVTFNRTKGGWKIRTLAWTILWTYPGEPIDEDQGWIAKPSDPLPQPPTANT